MSLLRPLARLARKRPSDIIAYLRAGPEARRLARRIDPRAFGELGARYRHAAPDPGYSKYLDAPFWIRSKLLRVRRLGLLEGPKLRILDLGTGPGYFPWLAAAYGHDVLGVDMPGTPFYDDLTALLGVRRRFHTVRPFERLPDWGRFDLVTAFQICFDQTPDGLWGASEWSFFLEDMDRQLLPGGRLVLEFNTPPAQTIAALLRSRGAPLHGLVSEGPRPPRS